MNTSRLVDYLIKFVLRTSVTLLSCFILRMPRVRICLEISNNETDLQVLV